ncbi:MAG: ABC transporter ATP-binding protein [Lachnospiraceae bacterium]|nr:ABC transporter ATP-binding protein [Lachnospiraceae bacterium]
MDIKSAFKVEHLRYAYDKGEEILHDIDVMIPEGMVTGILGANGCGKSTLLKLLAGNRKPKSGRITLFHEDIRSYSRREYAKVVAVVHQQNTAPQDMTVRQVVAAGRTPYQCPLRYKESKEDQEIVTQVLEQMALSDLAEHPILDLSGGQMQRVWMAMALAQNTPVLLMDEITTYLDIHYQLEFMQMIRNLNQKYQKTEVMVLHDINQAMTYCDYIVVMKDGRVLAQGMTKEILTESLLEEAYGIRVHMMKDQDQRYCSFSLIEGETRDRKERIRNDEEINDENRAE